MQTTHDALPATGQVTITRTFGFSASHELRLLPEGHKCQRNHGHNYTVTATARMDGDGPIDWSPLADYLASTFDHRLINDQVTFHPTSELLVNHLVEWVRTNVETGSPITLVAMAVSETPSTSARWDGATNGITISKTFDYGQGEITLILGADEFDEFGFVTDFGDLKPFSTYLRKADTVSSAAALAHWFATNVEPMIQGRLVSVQIASATATERWERGDTL
ncbi:6-carboxytetrahydropterin synthase [Actinokineospora auranticolor]|uniref:6-carboxy-5,6,7,8-tetrahydropterin synthase n=1 Tax=Actinokineospora auranticolor TaxID=155976 RepID=A0A2S6GDP9_9PSEU|nr:6-carboxytetrahydropterin synthase [Actinokineospora auranticolor]PPK63349.1 6-pyruvoyl-tetrahydropterin synthase [Actinokineospora auranticolor]